MSKNIEKVFVTYEEIFCDEISVDVLYKNKGNINGYENEQGERLTQKEVIEWVATKYYNRRVYVEWCNSGKVRATEDEEKLYKNDAEYRDLVDKERIYILHLMEIEIAKIANVFYVSRPTVYKKIEQYKEKFHLE